MNGSEEMKELKAMESTTTAGTGEPVTVVEGRSLTPGHEPDYHAWVQRTLAASERFPGIQGMMALTPPAGQPGQRYLVFRFADEAAKARWEQSAEWAELLKAAAAFSTPHIQTATGLEPWFMLPGQSITPPPKWKMFLTILPSAYIISAVVILVLGRVLHDWSFLALNVVVTVCLGYLLTYVGLPLSTRILQRWLYPQAEVLPKV